MVAVPFQSQSQRAFMYAKHPDIAKRWELLTPKGGAKLPQHKMNVRPTGTSSEETFAPSVTRLPRVPGPKRDFSMLHPSQAARHKPAGSPTPNEKEAMQETGVQYVHGSRHRELGVPQAHTGLRGRDIAAAHDRSKLPPH